MYADKVGLTNIYTTLYEDLGDNSYILLLNKKINQLRFAIIVYGMPANRVGCTSISNLYKQLGDNIVCIMQHNKKIRELRFAI